MLVTAFLVNVAGIIVVKKNAGDNLVRSTVGYSKRGEDMLHPTLIEPEEEGKSNGLQALVIRSLLDNDRIDNRQKFLHNFIFAYLYADQSVIIFDKDGMNEFSNGIFADVYEDNGNVADYVRNSVGLINMNSFCELDCAKEIYDTLENNLDAIIKVNSYSVSNYIVQPASISILDKNENIIKSFDCKCDGEIITANNAYIYDDKRPLMNDIPHGFHNKMKNVYIGEKRADKTAEKLVDDVEFTGEDYRVSQTSYGFGHYISKSCEVTGDYAMICVFDFNFLSDVLLYIAVFFVIITPLTFLVKRKNKNEYY